MKQIELLMFGMYVVASQQQVVQNIQFSIFGCTSKQMILLDVPLSAAMLSPNATPYISYYF